LTKAAQSDKMEEKHKIVGAKAKNDKNKCRGNNRENNPISENIHDGNGRKKNREHIVAVAGAGKKTGDGADGAVRTERARIEQGYGIRENGGVVQNRMQRKMWQ
jgi:hypothetical protein